MSDILNLAYNITQALRVPKFNLIRSVFGEPETHKPKLDEHFETEFAAWWPPSWPGMRTLFEVMLRPFPSWPGDTSRGSARIDYVLSGGKYQAVCPCAEKPPVKDGERWFLINGICTDRRVADVNARMVCKSFGRPLSLLYNACNGVLDDVLECCVGKQWFATTDAARVALPELLDALRSDQVKKVVLISHSQGTIVAAVLLKALEELLVESEKGFRSRRHEPSPERRVARNIVRSLDRSGLRSALTSVPRVQPCLTVEQIAKLEMYNFANCATSMEPFVSHRGELVPWIESYGNEHDVVARLGQLAPSHGLGNTRIGGERYIRLDTWGHLLNAHYLYDFIQEHRAGTTGATPRLRAYAGNRLSRPRLFDYL